MPLLCEWVCLSMCVCRCVDSPIDLQVTFATYRMAKIEEKKHANFVAQRKLMPLCFCCAAICIAPRQQHRARATQSFCLHGDINSGVHSLTGVRGAGSLSGLVGQVSCCCCCCCRAGRPNDWLCQTAWHWVTFTHTDVHPNTHTQALTSVHTHTNTITLQISGTSSNASRRHVTLFKDILGCACLFPFFCPIFTLNSSERSCQWATRRDETRRTRAEH